MNDGERREQNDSLNCLNIEESPRWSGLTGTVTYLSTYERSLAGKGSSVNVPIMRPVREKLSS